MQSHPIESARFLTALTNFNHAIKAPVASLDQAEVCCTCVHICAVDQQGHIITGSCALLCYFEAKA